MFTALTTRLKQALAACSLAVLSSISVGAVQALSLPAFEDLSPRWALVRTGDSPHEVTASMGQPYLKSESVTLGIANGRYFWKDIKACYSARFVANFLLAKEKLAVGAASCPVPV